MLSPLAEIILRPSGLKIGHKSCGQCTLKISMLGALYKLDGIAIYEAVRRDQQTNIRFGVDPKVLVNHQRDRDYQQLLVPDR